MSFGSCFSLEPQITTTTSVITNDVDCVHENENSITSEPQIKPTGFTDNKPSECHNESKENVSPSDNRDIKDCPDSSCFAISISLFIIFAIFAIVGGIIFVWLRKRNPTNASKEEDRNSCK